MTKRGYLICIKENSGDYEVIRTDEMVRLIHTPGSYWTESIVGKSAVVLFCDGNYEFKAKFIDGKVIELNISQLAELILAAKVYDKFSKTPGKIFTEYRLMREVK